MNTSGLRASVRVCARCSVLCCPRSLLRVPSLSSFAISDHASPLRLDETDFDVDRASSLRAFALPAWPGASKAAVDEALVDAVCSSSRASAFLSRTECPSTTLPKWPHGKSLTQAFVRPACSTIGCWLIPAYRQAPTLCRVRRPGRAATTPAHVAQTAC